MNSIGTNTAEWYFVWDWWPVPRFLFSLLGADGCRAFVNALSERGCESRLLVSFALAIEHDQAEIVSENDLEAALVKICAPAYDFGAARSLERDLACARQNLTVEKDRNALARTQLTSDSPQALRRAMEAKALPDGRIENLALIRELLARKTKG